MTIRHRAISASAGSGKTFQLAHRFIRLLAEGVEPDRIIAVTFSRKAAGEIFESIVHYLCRAAATAEGAKRTAAQIEKPETTREEFLRLLRRLTERLHRLHIGTLDRFTIGVVRTFPMELGITTAFEIMDNEGDAAATARREVLDELFHAGRKAARKIDPKARQAFREAFKEATFGREEKRLEQQLETFFTGYRTHYHVLPSPEAWGNPKRIWPEGNPWLERGRAVEDAAEALRAALSPALWDPKSLDRWEAFIEAARTFRAGSYWSQPFEYMLKKLLPVLDELRAGRASISLDRRAYELPEVVCRPLLTLVHHVLRLSLGSALVQTRGLYRLLAQYEEVYDGRIKRRGRLTFDDAHSLLTPANPFSGGARLSRVPGHAARLYIDFRLDSKLDHWLLDEFQDTSDLQWEVLHNLVAELFQDTSGRRSFFCVGDVKQAIYGWRGGNARLFGRILGTYGEQIEVSPLDTSYRSSQPIIDTVNQVFGKLPADLPAGTVEEWQGLWRPHRVQARHVPRVGYAALLQTCPESEEKHDEAEHRYRLAARVINEVEPRRRNWSVAVLVRTNANGRAAVNVLRRECPETSVVHEGKAAIKDCPLVLVLLSLIRFAAHPGDTAAWEHVRMSPLGPRLAREGKRPDPLTLPLLRRIQAEGFQSFIRYWGSRLDEACPLDAFGQRRFHDFSHAAAEFDQTASRDINAFLRFVESYELRESAGDEAVRVMTIHQAKGLGFDVVILPDLQGSSMVRAGRIDFSVARDRETNRPLWALKMPRRLVAERDAVLAAQVTAEDERNCLDALSVLYVAMTRAKRALYMISSYPGKNSTSFTPATLLKTQLHGEPNPTGGRPTTIGGWPAALLYEKGERKGYEAEVRPPPTPARPGAKPLPAGSGSALPDRQRLTRVAPSGAARSEQRAALLFAPQSRQRFELGRGVHELFQRVGWIDEGDLDELVASWREQSPHSLEMKSRIIEHFLRALASEEVRRLLTRPREPVELWRERAFDVVRGNQWISGSFDRVVIHRQRDQRPLRATIIDYKSNEVVSEDELSHLVEHYRPQLELYRQALAPMLVLPEDRIGLRLVFTHPAKVVSL